MHVACPLHPSPFALLPNCLPILSFSVSLINQQITAMTAAHCFAPGKQFKMNLNWHGLGIHFILCMSALYNRSFCILKKIDSRSEYDAKEVPGNQVLWLSLQARQRPPHNPAGVSYACFPVAVVRTGQFREVEGAYMRDEVWVSFWLDWTDLVILKSKVDSYFSCTGRQWTACDGATLNWLARMATLHFISV